MHDLISCHLDAPHPTNLPECQFRLMRPQPIVAWTPARLIQAFGVWLMEETKLPHLANDQRAALTAPARNRHANK